MGEAAYVLSLSMSPHPVTDNQTGKRSHKEKAGGNSGVTLCKELASDDALVDGIQSRRTDAGGHDASSV